MYGLRLWASVVLFGALIERNNRFFDQCWVAEADAHSHSERVDFWRTVSDFCFSFWRKRVPLRCIFRRMGFSTSYNVTLWRGTRWLHIETLWAFISHWLTEDLALLFSTQGFSTHYNVIPPRQYMKLWAFIPLANGRPDGCKLTAILQLNLWHSSTQLHQRVLVNYKTWMG